MALNRLWIVRNRLFQQLPARFSKKMATLVFTIVVFLGNVALIHYFNCKHGNPYKIFASDKKHAGHSKTLGQSLGALYHHKESTASIKKTLLDPNQTCRIPVLKPFDPKIQSYISGIEVDGNCESNQTMIFDTDLHSNLIQLHNPSDLGYTFCCYQKFNPVLGGHDQNVSMDNQCIKIIKPLTPIPLAVDFIMVSCMPNSTNATLKPIDMFGFVHLKSGEKSKLEASEDFTETNKERKLRRKLNVVMLGLDGFSHMNFIRTMPRTYEYITKNLSAHGFNGYTKTGDNTFPNIVTVLTGQTVDELRETCWGNDSIPLDVYPFIWKKISAHGYKTAYGEDSVEIGNFNYAKPGFFHPPTDYYFNHLLYQLQEKLGHHKTLCYGPRMSFRILLDLMKKMAFSMDKTHRYFQITWSTRLTHDYLNTGKLGDEPLLTTLSWLKNNGYLEDSVLVLFSDHGIRFGEFRETLHGQVEERMPLLYFIFPQWFKERYPQALGNLIKNRERLTTHFDFHETLKDLLQLGNLDDIQNRVEGLDDKSDTLPRGISLFLPIPLRRTCKDAGIDGQYCLCANLKTVDVHNNSLLEEAARSVVYHINGMFVKNPQCSALALSKIIRARVFHQEHKDLTYESAPLKDADDPRLDNVDVTFLVILVVKPSEAIFEATTTRGTDGLWHVSDQISRLNLYGNQSVCTKNYVLKKFCFC